MALYWVINWLDLLSLHWFRPAHAWRSNAIVVGIVAGRLLHRNGSVWRKRADKAGNSLKTVSGIQQIQVGFIDRRTALLAAFAFGRVISATFVSQVTDSAGQQAQATLKRMANCRQKGAKVLMGDEPFHTFSTGKACVPKAQPGGGYL